MATIESSITIAGPSEAVFDLVTSARFWPRWHPATRWVGGVVERPFQLGDPIHERAQFGEAVIPVTWRVIEHERPIRAVLNAETAEARIEYRFRESSPVAPRPVFALRSNAATSNPTSDGGIEFSRALTYDETVLRNAFPDLAALQQLMHSQSETALAQLKRLIESILNEENNAPVSSADEP